MSAYGVLGDSLIICNSRRSIVCSYNKVQIGAGLALLTGLLAHGSLFAAGFYLSEVGTPHSLGTAGVANPTNVIGADSSWTNPAGMTGLNSSQMVAGMQVINSCDSEHFLRQQILR
jgi:long-subunit fatty acid transport protein